VIKEVPELRIIESDLWSEVQAIKRRHSSRWGNKRQTKKRLLTGLLKCGRCGGGMTISRGDRYYCSARREKGTCDANRGIAAPELEERVLAGVKDLLLGNQTLVDEFVAEFKRELVRLRSERYGADRRILKELQDVDRGIKRCVEFIAGGEGEPASVRDRLIQLEERKRKLSEGLKITTRTTDIEIHPNLPHLYRRKVMELQQVLNDEATRPQAVETIRSLMIRIEVSPGEARGHCDIVVVGALAQVLSFAQRKAGLPSDAGTSLMVAGVGFEPTTFRL
jgi:site-specific DNA recombinase